MFLKFTERRTQIQVDCVQFFAKKYNASPNMMHEVLLELDPLIDWDMDQTFVVSNVDAERIGVMISSRSRITE